MLKAEVFFNLGDYYKAELESYNCIAICPDKFPKVYFFLGYLSYKRGDYIESLKYLDHPIIQNLKEPYFSNLLKILEEYEFLQKFYLILLISSLNLLKEFLQRMMNT